MASEADRLTVHVLDTARGCPAEGMALTLSRDGIVLSKGVTDADGRCPGALVEGAALQPGVYEIAYDVAGWREGQSDKGFYDRITIRFAVGASPGHIHVPLLLSPYGYTTYRGS